MVDIRVVHRHLLRPGRGGQRAHRLREQDAKAGQVPRLITGSLEGGLLGQRVDYRRDRFFGTLTYEHLYRGYIGDGDALDMEVHHFRIIYNTIRPH